MSSNPSQSDPNTNQASTNANEDSTSLVDRTEALIGHVFDDEDLLVEAVTHASSANSRLQSNERMEFLGDMVLGFVVCDHLYHNYPELLEGDLTKIKSAVVSRRTCAQVSLQLGISDLLDLGKGMAGRRQLPSSVAAAVYESIIAAIYLDAGLEAAKKFILDSMKDIIEETAESSHQHNFKSILQQYSQKHMTKNPTYVLLDEKGPDHAKAFEICVEINGVRYESAWANSKKEAEQKAALSALLGLDLAERNPETGQVIVRES